MNKKEILSAVRNMFFSDNTTETFMDVKTRNGVILRIEDMTPGVSVHEVSESGINPVEDGEYILEDGTTLVVVEGMIEEIIEPTEDNSEADSVTAEVEMTADTIVVEAEVIVEAEPMVDEVTEEVKPEYATIEMVEELTAMVASLQEEVAMLKDAQATWHEAYNSEIKTVKESFSALSKEPLEESLTKKISFSEMTRDDKLKSLRR